MSTSKPWKDFWNQMHTSPRKTVAKDNHVALVLPKDYGWGMRQPTDNIWGLWSIENDSLAPVIGTKIATLIKQYGTNLDIIFDDPSFNYTQKYSTIYYWNGTTIQPPQSFFNLSSPTTIVFIYCRSRHPINLCFILLRYQKQKTKH